MIMILPRRKTLPHSTPNDLRGCPVFFVTVCGVPRGENQFEEKAHYIRENPVRAGLIERAEEWRFVWEPTQM